MYCQLDTPTILRNVKEIHPFNMIAYVFLLDHFHLLIRPTDTSNFSQIMQSCKRNFTQAYKGQIGVTGSMKFWQKRFWDHVIRNERDFQRHFDYIHYNPVKHRLVTRPEDWKHSSYHYWRDKGIYEGEWGWAQPKNLDGLDYE